MTDNYVLAIALIALVSVAVISVYKGWFGVVVEALGFKAKVEGGNHTTQQGGGVTIERGRAGQDVRAKASDGGRVQLTDVEARQGSIVAESEGPKAPAPGK